jgi:hypothetical protein
MPFQVCSWECCGREKQKERIKKEEEGAAGRCDVNEADTYSQPAVLRTLRGRWVSKMAGRAYGCREPGVGPLGFVAGATSAVAINSSTPPRGRAC